MSNKPQAILHHFGWSQVPKQIVSDNFDFSPQTKKGDAILRFVTSSGLARKTCDQHDTNDHAPLTRPMRHQVIALVIVAISGALALWDVCGDIQVENEGRSACKTRM